MNKEQKIDNWIKMTKYIHYIEMMIERKLKEQYNLSLKEFYVLYEIYKSENKKYKINDLIKVVDLSQSAMSRLIVRMEKTEIYQHSYPHIVDNNVWKVAEIFLLFIVVSLLI